TITTTITTGVPPTTITTTLVTTVTTVIPATIYTIPLPLPTTITIVQPPAPTDKDGKPPPGMPPPGTCKTWRCVQNRFLCGVAYNGPLCPPDCVKAAAVDVYNSIAKKRDFYPVVLTWDKACQIPKDADGGTTYVQQVCESIPECAGFACYDKQTNCIL